MFIKIARIEPAPSYHQALILTTIFWLHILTTNSAVNFHEIWRENSRLLEFEIKRNNLKNTRLMYTVFVRFYFGEKSALLKG